jgi:FkbM family methyltransferase
MNNQQSAMRWLTSGIKNMTRRLGVDIVKYNVYHSDAVVLRQAIRHFGVRTVLDVGANIGQYAEQVLKHGFQGRLFSFEPLAEAYQALQAASRRHRGWQVFNLGMGSQAGEILINVSENSMSSSILKVREPSLAADPTSRTINQQKIRLSTVDDFMAGHPEIEDEILLKLDVQGYEIEALKGALKNLNRIRLIQAELSFAPLYDNAPRYEEVVDYLKARKFELFSVMPGFRDEQSGQMLQADGLFVRQG